MFLHGAYSTYECKYLLTVRALAKSVHAGAAELRIPFDVRCVTNLITAEVLVSFVLLVLGCTMTAPALKGISWADHMRDRCVRCLQLCRSDARATKLCQRAAPWCDAVRPRLLSTVDSKAFASYTRAIFAGARYDRHKQPHATGGGA